MNATTASPTARVGDHAIYKTGATTFVLVTVTGETVGTFSTARAAMNAGVARIAAAYRASKRA